MYKLLFVDVEQVEKSVKERFKCLRKLGFEVGDGWDSCDVCLFLLHHDTSMYANVPLLITLVVNELDE